MEEFLPSELILTQEGQIYHLGIAPDELAHKIIIVGDQARVEVVSNYFDEVTHKSQHREFSCHTGTYKGKHLSVVSTGIGTDNIDIVLNELDALVNINFNQRQENNKKVVLEIVRIGTCGILQDDIPVDSFILSSHAMGIDNLGHFYQLDVAQEDAALLEEIEKKTALPEKIHPYLTAANTELVARLASTEIVKGITITASGFYGPQGRKLRLPLAEEKMLNSFSDFRLGEHRFTNLEMECSALFALSKSLGHKAAAICLGLANRRKKEFSSNYEARIRTLIEYVLDCI